MSDFHVTNDGGKVLIFARDPETSSATTGFSIRPWSEIYAPKVWLRSGQTAGYGCYMVESADDVHRLVSGHYDTGLSTAVEHAEHVADVMRRATDFGLEFGHNWEPLFASWETEPLAV